MALDNSDNEEEILNKVYSCQEGCFLYLRDEQTSPRPSFLDFIQVSFAFPHLYMNFRLFPLQNTIQSTLQKHVNKKLWRIENLAFKSKFDLLIFLTR